MKKRILFSAFLLSAGFMYSCSKKPQTQKAVFPSAPSATGNAENLTRETSEPSNEFYPLVEC